MKPAVVSAFVVMAMANPFAVARGLENYPYDRLFKEADLVVFANPLKTEVTDDKWEKSDLKFTGVNTTLVVKHTLKGAVDGDRIRVLHFTLDVDGRAVINGPLLLTFKINQPLAEHGFGPEYLLFLKKTKDGRYEPVSGRFDPVLSIKEISEPSLSEASAKKANGDGQGRRGR